MEPGTYTLVLELDSATTVEFGAAGTRDLAAGYYAYTGSAFGPGGLSRIDRHRSVLRGENDTRHWHIDHLLGTDAVGWVGAWSAPHRDAECEVATSLRGDVLPGIGATDCDCVSHLHYNRQQEPLVASIVSAYEDR